uniref:XK-related protein n=1 Tax=Lepeophtheirus salmonis TaxID=72036 RepID=A0A0K2UWA8_LEPSM
MMSFSEETGGTPHPICFLEDESIVLKIMQIYHPNLYSTRKDWKGYNILHYCADKNFINAIILFLEFDQQDVIFSLLHMNDSSSPIAVAAQSGNENIARIMYNYLDSNITDDQFLSFFRFNEFKSTSLLRICSQQKLHCLLKDIINSFEKRGISNELLPFLTVQNKVDGERTLLQNIQSESILIKLIPLYLKNDSRNLLLKCKKEKHLGHYLAEKNYSKILLTIHQHCTNNNLNDLFFFDFLLSPNKYGDDCCKLAAWKGSNEFLVTALSLCRGLNKSYLSLLLHGTNQNQENLMELLLFQQRSLIVPRQIIMLMEKEVHSDNKILILSCYRVHISPSEELVSLIEDTEKLLPLSNTKKTLICLKKIIILIFSLLLFCLDIGFDISLAIQYYKDSDEACKHDFTDYSSQSLLEEESNFHRATRYVGALCSSTRFYVTLLFIISPWLFYIFEFIRETFINDRPMWIVHVPFKEIKLTSYRSNEQQAILLNAKAVQLMDKRLKWRSIFGCCSSFNNFCTNLLFIFGFISEFVVTIAFWPIISMFRLFYADVMYDIQHGIKKIKARELKVSATKICSRARLIEALLESSFQPIIQLYIVFPILINNITSDKSIDLSRDLYLEASQFGSAITSITTLSWAITLYQSNIKGGALDLTVNFLGRIILLISNLFLITGRMLLFIVFAYGFGAGRLIGLIIFIIIHIIASTILIHYWRDPSFTITSKITYFINCVINGFGNTYLHMWIQLPQNLISEAKSGKSTFVRHLLFETIFFLELISMITFTYFMLDSRIAEAIQLKYLTLLIFGLYFIGNALKIFYYKTQHIWNELISIERDIKRLALRVFG